MEEKIIKKINEEIEQAKKDFEKWKQTSVSNEMFLQVNAKIQGMITILEIVTGKNYYYDNNGLHEQQKEV